MCVRVCVCSRQLTFKNVSKEINWAASVDFRFARLPVFEGVGGILTFAFERGDSCDSCPSVLLSIALASREREAVPLIKEQLSGSGCCCDTSSKCVGLISMVGESNNAAAMPPSISEEEHFRIFPGRFRPSGVLGEFMRGLTGLSPQEAAEERALIECTTSSIIAVSAAFLRNGMCMERSNRRVNVVKTC